METLKIKISEDIYKISNEEKYVVAIKHAREEKEFFLESGHPSGELFFTEEFNNAYFFSYYLHALTFAKLICASTSDPNQEILLYSFYKGDGGTKKTKKLKISQLDV
jgi:hypothetical protein